MHIGFKWLPLPIANPLISSFEYIILVRLQARVPTPRDVFIFLRATVCDNDLYVFDGNK